MKTIAIPKPWVFSFALVVMTLLVYLPALHGGFVWDDDSWTTGIPQLLRDVSGLRSMWGHPTALQQYYPLTGTTFWLDYHLWGFWTLPYHVENVLLHAFATLLFWRLLWRLRVPGAWLAAAIFALHPVMVESAGWITERKNVLSLVLYLGALLVYGRFASFWNGNNDSAAGTDNPLPHRMYYLLAWLLALGALLAKTTAFSLPAVILLISWWKRGRIRWREDVEPTVPFFALAILLGLVTARLEKNGGASGPEWAISLPERCLIAGRALVFYSSKLLWPRNLCFVYPRWQLNAHSLRQWLYPGVAVGAILGLWVARRRIGRGPAAAAFFFVGTLFPLLGFMNAYYMRYSFVCDHWVYLSSLGPIALVAAAMTTAFKSFQRRRVLVESVFYGALLLILAACTWRQARIYRDAETLWRDTLAKNPGAWMAHNNLGALLKQSGRRESAFEEYELAVRINPDDAYAQVNLGTALMDDGKVSEAVTHFERAVKINPNYVTAHNSLGVSLLNLGRLPEATAEFQRALQLDPNFADAHYNLGLVALQAGQLQDAIAELRAAAHDKADSAEYQFELGLALKQAGRIEEAIAHYQRAVQIAPNNPNMRINLGNSLLQAGMTQDAIAQYEEALHMAPDSVVGHFNLGNALLQAGRTRDAITHYEEAVRLKPDFAPAQKKLAQLRGSP
ncbi:MAG: tetratricopeptide repeat protein [Verrucomicrobiia bacterium]